VVVPEEPTARAAFRAERINRRSALESQMDSLLANAAGDTVPADVVSQFEAIESQIRSIDREISAVDAIVDRAPVSADSIRSRAQNLRNRPQSVNRRCAPMAPHFSRDVDDKRQKRTALLAFRSWVLPRDCSQEERSAAHEIRMAHHQSFRVRLFESKREREERAAMTTAANLGGETVSIMMAEAIERELKHFNPLLSVAKIYNHRTGEPFKIPTIDDTGNDGVRHTEGAAAITPRAIATDGKTLNSWGCEDAVETTRVLLRDTYYADLPETVGELMGEALGRKMAADHLLGDGTGDPQGIVTGAGAGITTALNNAISMSDIIKLIASVNYAYHNGSMFFMSLPMWSNLLELTDATGRPLIGDVVNADKPMLKGFPVEICPGMQETITATTVPMLFGNPKKFAIRLVGDLEIRRLDEIAALRNAVVFYGIQFHDSRVISNKAIKKMTQKT
jgi:HK97 family phage major capsid protein